MRFLYVVAIIALIGFTVALATEQHQTVTVKRSDDGRWLEVYHDGGLSAEWQRSDGAVFEYLEILLTNDYEDSPRPPLRERRRRTSPKVATLLL